MGEKLFMHNTYKLLFVNNQKILRRNPCTRNIGIVKALITFCVGELSLIIWKTLFHEQVADAKTVFLEMNTKYSNDYCRKLLIELQIMNASKLMAF